MGIHPSYTINLTINQNIMNQTWKVIVAVIITVIVGGGVYYWQNSKTSSLQTPVTEKASNTIEELPIANKPTEQPKEETSVKTTESTDETANWKTYSSTGVSIKYPNDGTYSVDEQGIDPSMEGFTISQEHPGNKVHIYKASDSSVLSSDAKTKIINGKTYKVFYREGVGSGYGYIIERNGQFYTFESVWGPENEVFELMMYTVKFE